MDVSITLILALCMLIILILFALQMPKLLPEKYFFDAIGVADYMATEGDLVIFGNSFENTGLFLSKLGFAPEDLPAFGAILVFSSIFYGLLRGGRSQRIPQGLAIYACIWAVVMTVYLGQPSKEMPVSGLVLAFLLMTRTKTGLVSWLVLALLYASYFRPYWFVVLAIFCGTYLFGRQLNSRFRWLMFVISIYGLLALYVDFVMEQSLSSWRNDINVDRELDPNSVTMIASLLPGEDILSSLLNALGALSMLVVPLPLLMQGQIQYLAAFLLIPSAMLLTYSASRKLLKEGGHNTQSHAAVNLFFSFIVVQGLFEPDYGSFLKHLSPFAPIIMYLLASAASVPTFHSRKQFLSAHGNDTEIRR